MKIGVVQGRLSKPVNGHIQEFPFSCWKMEFDLIEKMGLNHIEWILTKESFDYNPIFNDDLNDLRISSICCDHLIDENIHNINFLDRKLTPVCHSAQKNNINNISIPLLEDSNMEDDTRRKEFLSSILSVKRKFPKMNFIFETELTPEKTADILYRDSNFLLTYDTGNVTSYLKTHNRYIEILFDRIANVHIKDRTFEGVTVEPFKGNTDFLDIFKILKNKNYKNIFTLQIARGLVGKEKEYIQYWKQKFEELYEY